ncbi:MAG: arginyltransferase [Proteobacteria bacterium]|nr:arginyltransferase [Pseudomonadota bacterium]
MKSDVVRLFQTLPHPCGYFAERTAQNLVIDPASPQLPQIYDSALARGYRRAGGHVYRPHCPGCRACIPARIPVAEFVPDRSQRRCLSRNRDLDLRVVRPGFNGECFDLYRRYLEARHKDGGMDDPATEDFERFLFTAWSPTRFLEFRLRERLLAVAVTDFTATSLSAVYTFFDPAEPARGLGTYAILRQLELARMHDLTQLYLGFWIARHPKMDYKARFHPLEVLEGESWRRLNPCVPGSRMDDRRAAT